MALKFGWVELNGDDVPGLQRIFIPAKKADGRWTSRFAGPMGNVALVILHVEQKHGMGIGPQEFRHRGLLHDNYLVRFVRSTSVVCEHGAAQCWKNTEQGQRHEQLTQATSTPFIGPQRERPLTAILLRSDAAAPAQLHQRRRQQPSTRWRQCIATVPALRV